MAANEKTTILLADEDSLRRDGLTAMLEATAQFEIVAQSQDGLSAMRQIRELVPQVAIIDLNLPKLHGIELIRKVRSEELPSKIIIVSGTTDEDVIREVVRAGADGFLLKNGPARHLLDAISYVRDGGQYFSPQLRRDGLDRHLLEEPRLASQDSEGADPGDERDSFEDSQPERVEKQPAREPRYGRARRPVRRGEATRFRERLKEEPEGQHLEERDYEILGMMADGIRPILDRLDDIEGRVVDMESGSAPVPSNVRGWLSSQIADTFRDPRSNRQDVTVRTVNDLEARLPGLIEEAVTARFHNMADRLQKEIEETHVRTLEAFVKNIQVKLVRRVSALETDMTKQAEAMHQLRESSQRTEDNLSRLVAGVDKLAKELPGRLQNFEATPDPRQEPASGGSYSANPPRQPSREKSSERPREKSAQKSSRKFSPKKFWAVVGVLALVAGVGFGVSKLSKKEAPTPAATAATTAPASAQKPIAPPAASADTKTRMQAAQQYSEAKDYSIAEDLYRQVIKSEPNNTDAMKALASVLYREDKIDESAAILDKLPKN